MEQPVEEVHARNDIYLTPQSASRQGLAENRHPNRKRRLAAGVPNTSIYHPEDVARCIAALCHPATYWLTGNTLQVDGARTSSGRLDRPEPCPT
jgi:NAD(P)-dependent dehydrogenase (short-subunit alcohol dehydrogenase family)